MNHAQSGPCMVYVLQHAQLNTFGSRYYVGMTQKPLRRWAEHATPSGKRSCPAVVSFGFEKVISTRWYVSRQVAFEEERRLTNVVRRGGEVQEDACSCIEPAALKLLSQAGWAKQSLASFIASKLS
jgi:predicted GIY-YIG superfamily endonuclease